MTELVPKRNVELGKALVEEAQELYNEERKKTVLGEVQRLMRSRDEYKEVARRGQLAVEWYEKKLAALHAGEFDVALSEGVSPSGALKFRDADLNRANF